MLYLIDEPMAEIAFRTVSEDPDATLVLIQDGVLLDPDPDLDVPAYAVEEDVAVRGRTLPDGVEPIDYDRVLSMLLEQEVTSFV